MRVFVTGATGSIGSPAVDELLGAGHDVTALARSDRSADAVVAKGATVLRGDLDDLDALRRGADGADAVVHLANKHDWTDPTVSNRAELAAVETLGDALTGSDRPFLLAGVVAGLARGRPATEDDPAPAAGLDVPHAGSESLALRYVERGVHVVAVRFPLVHGAGDHGLFTDVVAAARRTGVSAYVGDGSDAWSAVHRADAGQVVRLALERAPAGAAVHAVAERGVRTRDIAGAIGRALGLPVTSVDVADAVRHFGFVGAFFGTDLSATSDRTRELLGWVPSGPTLIEDVDAGVYTPEDLSAPAR